MPHTTHSLSAQFVGSGCLIGEGMPTTIGELSDVRLRSSTHVPSRGGGAVLSRGRHGVTVRAGGRIGGDGVGRAPRLGVRLRRRPERRGGRRARFRSARASEIDAVLALWHRAYDPTPAREADDRDAVRRLVEGGAGGRLLVAEHDGNVIGTVIAGGMAGARICTAWRWRPSIVARGSPGGWSRPARRSCALAARGAPAPSSPAMILRPSHCGLGPATATSRARAGSSGSCDGRGRRAHRACRGRANRCPGVPVDGAAAPPLPTSSRRCQSSRHGRLRVVGQAAGGLRDLAR